MTTPSGPARATRGRWIFPAILAATFGAAAATLTGLTPTGVWVFLVVVGGWVITLCLHEFAHAAVALAGGDTSVRARGYLTLNPARYTDVTYSVVIPLLLLAVGGIPLPGGAVLVEPGRLRRRWYASLVSAAGPATNMACGLLLTAIAVPLAGTGSTVALGAAVSYLALLQFVAGLLNLLPVPGFDGFGIVEPFLPARFLQRIRPLRPWLPLAVFAILFSVPGASTVLFQAGNQLFTLVGGSDSLAAAGSRLFRFWA